VSAELGAAGMSYLASQNPRSYGSTFVLLSPFLAGFGESRKSPGQYMVSIAILAGYGAYNGSMKDEKESTVFRNNMILFNAAIVATLINPQYFESTSTVRNREQVFSFGAVRKGGVIYLRHVF
jgi:hypothetical protein